MKIYLAHNFKARNVLNQVVKPFLESNGHIITSRWIWDDSHLEHFEDDRSAIADLEDIESASAIILFTDQYGSSSGKGKFLELGYAIKAKKICILCGEDLDSSVFYKLSTIKRVKTIEETLRYL